MRFRYPGRAEEVLHDVNALLPAGKVTALVGANGAGKSTLVKLLTRMYDPTGGTILLDARELVAYDLASLRARIAVVYQDLARFALSLGENIAVAGAARFEAVDGGRVAAYAHPPRNKIGVLLQLRGGSDELARKVAMHIAAMRPEWIGRDDVPAEDVERERQIFGATDEVQSKPEQAREKIVEGMLNKRFFGASVLIDQDWIHDSSKKVGQALAEEGAEVLEFERFELSA